MKKSYIKSIVMLMVAATAVVFASCSKDDAGVWGGIEVDENDNPVGTTYELLSSEHISMSEPSVAENVATFTSEHKAIFSPSNGNENVTKNYTCTASVTLGLTTLAAEDLANIENNSFTLKDGVFNIAGNNIPAVISETKVSAVRVGSQTFSEELSRCIYTGATLAFLSAEQTGEKEFSIPALLTPDNECKETADAEFLFKVVITAEDDQVTEEIKNVELTDKGIEYDYVVEHTVNTELNSTTHFVEKVNFGLQAEAKKTFDTEELLSLNNPEPSINGKVYSFTWNLFVNKVTAAYPEEVVLSQGNATYTFTMPTPVVSMTGMSSNNSSDANYDYVNYTINYNMMVNGVNVAKATQEVSTRVKAVKDEVTYTFENVKFTENGVEYDFVEKHSVNTELNSKTHHIEKVNFSLTAESKKVVNTEEALALLSSAPSVNGKVYSFSWNLFKNNLTASYPAQVTLSQKGQTHIFNMPQPAVRMEGMTQNAGQDATYNYVEYVITYVMTVNNIEVASATQLVRTQSLIPVNPTIPGYHLLKANQCDYYTESRDGWVASPIYAIFAKDNDNSQMLFVEFDENTGAEKSRETINGINVPNFPLGRAYRTGEGTAPAYVQTNETEYMWTSLTNENFYSTVSVVSSVSQSLRNPVAYGTSNPDGSISFSLSNGTNLVLK